MQAQNIQHILDNLDDNSVVVFTDGSALGNPGPTGAGACIYMNGLDSTCFQLKQPIHPLSNNFVGELNGIMIALKFLEEKDISNRNIHLFVDCQPAMKATFSSDIPSANFTVIIGCRKIVLQLEKSGNFLQTHWIPGHKNIPGNELADKLAKEAAAEMIGKTALESSRKLDKKECTKIIRDNLITKWQRRYENSQISEKFMEIFPTVGKKQTNKVNSRSTEVFVNQILAGQCKLNFQLSKYCDDVKEGCPKDAVKETVEHFLYDCIAYKEERDELERNVEEILYRYDYTSTNLDLKVLSGNLDGDPNMNRQLSRVFQDFLQSTGRF